MQTRRLLPKMSDADVHRLVYELHTHQAELEVQNKELRTTQIDLSEARDRYQDLYDFAPVAFVTLDSCGTILEANFAAANLLMVDRARLVGRPLTQFVTRGSLGRFAEHLGNVQREFSRQRSSVELCNSRGNILTVQLESVAEEKITTPGMDKKVTTRMAILDLTERAKAESALRQSENQLRRLNQQLQDDNARKDEFLAMLAHELRNPLAAIGCAVRISGSFTEPDKIAWAQQVLQRQTAHLSRMVNDLLDISRLSRGKVELRRQVLDVSPLLQAAVDALENVRAARNHHLEVTIEKELYTKADPTRIEQVIGNLLMNAYKYTPDGGHIKLLAKRSGLFIQLSVNDNGVGIAPEMLPKVFDLFVQGPVSLERAKGGLGIGLTLVKNLVEMHGGRVQVDSPGLGKGAIFIVLLPAESNAPQASKEHQPAPKKEKGSSRVLIVEDNYDSGIGMRDLIEMEGFIVRLVGNGKEAIHQAKEFAPDYVLLDIGLPGMDGYQVAKEIRNNPGLSDTAIIGISGYGRQEDIRRSAEAGFNFHMVKPLDFEELLRILAKKPQELHLHPRASPDDVRSALPAA